MISRTAAAFLFDMDGTLISSVAAAERVWGRWAARQGLEVPAFLRTIHGVRAVDVISHLGLPGLDPAAEAAQIARDEIDDVGGIAAIAGAEHFLDALPPERWAIVTSAPRALALVRLKAAGLVAPAVLVTGEDTSRGKPAPDCFILGARRLGFDVRDCVIFEDAPAGIAAGEAAGAAALVVVNAAGAADAVQGPHPSIASYDELVASVSTDGLTLRRNEA